jgi:uncharacterized protein CbrC (UPF0167 family)
MVTLFAFKWGAGMVKAKVSDLPQFKYHPNPLHTGAIEDSEANCECCGQARGFIYRGHIYSVAKVEQVCPWCIADGSVHAKWDAEFTDSAAIGGWGSCSEVPREVWEEVAYRTPGFAALQEARWWTHCGDAAEFLGIEDDRVRFRCRVCGKRGSYRDFD